MGYIEKTYGRSEKFLAFNEPNATVAYLSSLEGSREERAFELAKEAMRMDDCGSEKTIHYEEEGTQDGAKA